MMLSRALGLATVTLLIGCCTAGQVQAQENLDAGQSPSQIFATTCTACHKSPRGLVKTVAPGSLPGFLREHYTTGPDMAHVLASYLISNGAVDTRYDDKPKGAKQAGSAGNPASPPEQPGFFGRLFHPAAGAPQGAEPQPEHETRAAANKRRHRAHNAKRATHPAETPAAGKPAAEGSATGQEASTGAAKPESGKSEADKSAAAAQPTAATSAGSDTGSK
jgi:hypothetical protein